MEDTEAPPSASRGDAEHTANLTGPTAEGHWAWHCLNTDCPQEGNHPDLSVVLDAAAGHGTLSQDPDIIRIINTASRVDGLDKALAWYDNECIPNWERKFPDRAHEAHSQRAALQAERDQLLTPR